MKKLTIIILIVLVLTLSFLFTFNRSIQNSRNSETKRQNQNTLVENETIKVVAENLDTPWSMVFLPNGSMLVTERSGSVRFIDEEGNLDSNPVITFSNVSETQEGGLLGITIHPNFELNNFVYFYQTYKNQNGETLNRVVRMIYENKILKDERVLIEDIPGAPNHDGGRIKFGPDGFLYVTTGDAQNSALSQDINSLAGKILRLTDEGEPAPENPFDNFVYSYGHRNSQGITWDEEGFMFATEHGRSGIASGLDEINLIEKGNNYGWPEIEGDEEKTGMEKPVVHSGSSNTWAPTGIVYLDGSLFFGGLRGQALYEAVLGENNQVIEVKEHFKNQFGRIRDVVLSPEKGLYIATSNRDGRGNPVENDDKIIKIDVNSLR